VTAASDPFEALAEHTDALVFVTDLQMRMQYANPALQRQTGFTAADFQFPQEDNPFIHREDAEHVARALSAFVESAALVSPPIENRFLDRWGRTHRYRSVVTKIRFRDAEALLFVCRALDAPTDNADNRQYRALLESSDDAIIRVDNAGRFLFANGRTHELLGYTPVELGHLRLDDVVAARDREMLNVQFARSVAASSPVRFETRLLAKQGQEVRMQAALTSLGRFGLPGELLAILREAPRT